jgi:hypothetical protein
MPECQCGNHVSPRYQRVFGGPDGAIEGCPACMDGTSIRSGAAHPAKEPVERADDTPRREVSRQLRRARQ